MAGKKEGQETNIISNRSMRRTRGIITAVAVVLVVIVIAVVAIALPKKGEAKDLEEALSLGEKYLSELNYEQAIASYQAAIEIDPKCVDAYIGLADTYLAMGEPEEAVKVLEQAETVIASGGADEKTEEALKRIREKKEKAENAEKPEAVPTKEPILSPTNTPTPEVTEPPTMQSPSPEAEPSHVAGVIDWQDAALEQAIRDVTGITDRVITEEDVAGITELDLSGKGIGNIGALKYMPQLSMLNLSNNEISDISVLAGLPELKELHLDGNKISDFRVLLGLGKLEVFYVDSGAEMNYDELFQLAGFKECYVDGVSVTPEPTPTGTLEPTPTSTLAPEVVEAPTSIPTPEPVENPTNTPEPTPASTPTPTPTPTNTPTPTSTPTPTPTPTNTPTPTSTPTPEPTEEPEPDAPDLGIVKLEEAQVGDTVLFGHYEQDNDTGNGKEDIEWIVLDEDGDKLLLLSKYALDCKRYAEEWAENWESCTLRAWLNDEFYNAAFSKAEQDKIETTRLDNRYGPGDMWSKYTNDKVFLLSAPEATSYFSSDKNKRDPERQAKASEYAKARGASVNTSEDYYDNCIWWLRAGAGEIINFYGSFETVDTDRRNCAVRPVIWVDCGAN